MSGPILKQQGFTIVELMVVVTIVSILAVIAIPVYADYATRSKVSEGLAFIAEAKTSITEAFYSTGSVPTGNNEAGLQPPEDYDDFEHISRLEVGDAPVPGTITVTFRIPLLGDDNLLQLVPSIVNGQVAWECTPAISNGIARNRIPPSCRG